MEENDHVRIEFVSNIERLADGNYIVHRWEATLPPGTKLRRLPHSDADVIGPGAPSHERTAAAVEQLKSQLGDKFTPAPQFSKQKPKAPQ